MAIEDDLAVATSGAITWTNAADVLTAANQAARDAVPTYTVLQTHRFLQALAGSGSSVIDDFIDITSVNPSLRATNQIVALQPPYFIDEQVARHLYGGSVSQVVGGNPESFAGVRVIGSVNRPTTELSIIQEDIGAAGTIDVITPWWGTGINQVDDQGLPDSGVLLRTTIKVRDTGFNTGALIDGGRVIVLAREFQDTFAEFQVTLGTGESVAAIATLNDTNNANTIAEMASAPFSLITNTPGTDGFVQLDVDNNGTDENYYSLWDLNAATNINDIYQRTKSLQITGETALLYGLEGQIFRGITHTVAHGGETGTFVSGESITYASGTAQVLSVDDAGNQLHVQLLTGAPPADTEVMTGATSGATATASGVAVSRTVSPTFIGTSTGSAINAAFGIGIDPADLKSADTLSALDGVSRNPPNNQRIVVSGIDVTAGNEDYIFVARSTGVGLSTILTAQFSITGPLTAGDTTVEVNELIGLDGLPSSGVLRIFNSVTGIFDRVPYDSIDRNSDSFVVNAGIPNNVDNAAEMFVPLIDRQATAVVEEVTVVFTAPLNLVARIRNGFEVANVSPIVPFETPGVFGAGGAAFTAIRTLDA